MYKNKPAYDTRMAFLTRKSFQIKISYYIPLLDEYEERFKKMTWQQEVLQDAERKIDELQTKLKVITKERDQLKDAHDTLILQAKKTGEDFSQQLRTIYGPVDKQYFVKI